MDGLGLVACPLFSIYRWSCCSARVWHHCSTLKTSCSDAAILHTPLGLSRQTMSISGWIGGLVPQFLTCSPLPLSLPRISLGNLSIRTVTPLWAGTSPATLCCIYVLSPAQEELWRFACATSQPLENPLNLLSKSNLSLIMTLSSFQKCSIITVFAIQSGPSLLHRSFIT